MPSGWNIMLVVIYILFVQSYQAACPDDVYGYHWFGTDCQYKCHCKNNVTCDVINGDCPNGCDTGWFGPACQYVDALQNGSIQTTDVSSAGIALLKDANDETCSHPTNDIFQLKFVLVESYIFTWLRLVHIGPVEIFTIKFTETTAENSALMDCYPRQNSTVDGSTLDIYCNVQKSVQQIIINGTTTGTLCSFYVNGGRNVALRQSTSQTSDFDGSSYSLKAVDGNDDQSFGHNSCSHTKYGDLAPSWTLHMRSQTRVTRYKIYNRIDCCSERLRGFILNAYGISNSTVLNYIDQKPVQNVYSVIPVNLSDVTTVQITSTNTIISELYLSLCEVKIYGDTTCAQVTTNFNTYGRDCENVCNCAVEGEKCFVSTGNCPSGCKAGFYGQGCKKLCDPTYYGVDCQKKCSSNCEGRLCDGSHGNCVRCATVGKQLPLCENDCPSGYYGYNCTLSCPQNCVSSGQICSVTDGSCVKCKDGFYGDNCTSSCPVNCNEVSCEQTTGYCTSCKPGFHGNVCSLICPANCLSTCDYNSGNCLNCKKGFFSANCSKPCSSNCIGGTCSADTGLCDKCSVGYYGSQCDKVCPNGTYGDGCNDKCSTHCIVDAVSSPCHHASGVCLLGCRNSYTDSKCVGESSANGDRGQSIGIGVGIGIGTSCVVGGIIAVVVYIVLKRRQKPERKSEEPRTYDHVDQGPIEDAKYEGTKSYANDYRTGENFMGSNNSKTNVKKAEAYENIEMNPYDSLNEG
ncbi:unnamed protein product [Lymnaea stagnalis]|uniref:Uncharacterized protein n=1 Tax=Lymnaea stagnalis TaxID=6523 RepID=A0AAV2HFV3_LYMST